MFLHLSLLKSTRNKTGLEVWVQLLALHWGMKSTCPMFWLRSAVIFTFSAVLLSPVEPLHLVSLPASTLHPL